MNANNGPEDIPLFFPILDGPKPKEWSLYGQKFPLLIEKAHKSVRPHAVPVDLLNSFSVHIEPIWSDPQELLKEKRLDKLAGIIIEALPKQDIEEDLKQKVKTLRSHIRQIKLKTKSNDDALFKRFGYSIWFMTDNPANIVSFVQNVRDAAAMLDGIAKVNHQFFMEEQALLEHLATYLSNVYLTLERGN
jgi:hypothetical protein